MDSFDLQLQRDLATVNKGNEPDLETIKRLSKKLHLTTVTDLRRESTAIHDMMLATDGCPEENCIDMMSFILKEIKGCVMLRNPEVDMGEGERSVMRHQSPVIPDDFRCPISFELMKDPMIVSIGQYDEISLFELKSKVYIHIFEGSKVKLVEQGLSGVIKRMWIIVSL